MNSIYHWIVFFNDLARGNSIQNHHLKRVQIQKIFSVVSNALYDIDKLPVISALLHPAPPWPSLDLKFFFRIAIASLLLLSITASLLYIL